jgi:MFS family permease
MVDINFSVISIGKNIYNNIYEMGDYYCFDNPGAMHSLLKKRFGNDTGEKFEYIFNLMYSVYSLPNVILPLIGGLLIFKYGYRLMFLIFGSCVLFGQLIFAVGCTTKSIKIMLIGRVIFGLGGESLNTTQYAIIIQWFASNEIGFAMGLCLSLARLGNVMNDVISPRIATVNKD